MTDGLDLTQAAALGSATVHEAAGRVGALRADMLPAAHAVSAAGPAFTVQCPSGDNLWLHRAIAAASPGDVLVVATGDDRARWGYWGEIMSVAARERGLAGLVLEGGSRDHGELAHVGFPVWSLGRCITGTVKDPDRDGGALCGPIRVGDVSVRPGDLIVADVDGVVVIERAGASDVIAAAARRRIDETRIIAELVAGRTTLDLLGLQ
ncbi:RraA family protein [Desertimonas flava]|uniref:RraA family protein n=1 Tax=Desertimonas flava TaxID=2064846 RepID=UPI000E34DD93|nr:4-hydroxy-4-methyl-2-oxoglutarate aldolase [Desertimonas flava]